MQAPLLSGSDIGEGEGAKELRSNPKTLFTVSVVVGFLVAVGCAALLSAPNAAIQSGDAVSLTVKFPGRNPFQQRVDHLQQNLAEFPVAVQKSVSGFLETQRSRTRILRELKRQPTSQRIDVVIPEVEIATKEYPQINLNTPGLRVLNQNPPIYMVDNFLDNSECDALISSAKSGDLEGIKYSGQYVLLDNSRLWPLLPMTFLSAVPGSHALESAPSVQTVEHYLQVLGPNALMVGSMLLLVPRIVEILGPMLTKTSGAEFKGSKWVGLGDLDEQNPARHAQETLLRKAEDLCFARRTQFERPTVTQYQKGQGQAIHADAYHPPEPGKLEEYLAGGGQRMAQCLVYLNDVPKEDGGSTKFFHPSAGGLEVQPKKGSALVFFPAFADGTEDPRMMHSGETYVGEKSKWTAGTWLHQSDVPLTPHRLGTQSGR